MVLDAQQQIRHSSMFRHVPKLTTKTIDLEQCRAKFKKFADVVQNAAPRFSVYGIAIHGNEETWAETFPKRIVIANL
jgi:hypothetical protein